MFKSRNLSTNNTCALNQSILTKYHLIQTPDTSPVPLRLCKSSPGEGLMMNFTPRAGLGRLGDMESENHRFCEEHVFFPDSIVGFMVGF